MGRGTEKYIFYVQILKCSSVARGMLHDRKRYELVGSL